MFTNKIVTQKRLLALLPQDHDGIVLTTGVFDILHEGHFSYLYEARKLGKKLIVGLHSDLLVKARKGDSRPYFKELKRTSALAYLPFVDYLFIISDQEDLYESIELISPQILVVSETTDDKENCPEEMLKRFGSLMQVKVLPPQSSLHTSDIMRIMEAEKK